MNFLLTTAILALPFSVLAEVNGCQPRRRVNCRKPACCSVNIASYDFVNTYPQLSGPSQDFQFADILGTLTDDGLLTFGCLGGGVLNSVPFTHWSGPSAVPEADHPKWFASAINTVSLTTYSKVIIEWTGSVEVLGTCNNPFPAGIISGDNDFRLGNGAFVATDGVYTFSFLLTNDRIYIVYSKDPYNRGLAGYYAAFTYVIPVSPRKPCDWHCLKVTLDSSCKVVTWQLDGKTVFTVKQVGDYICRQSPVFDYGGSPTVSFPTNITYGFGTFTGVNYYPTANCDGRNRYPPIREALVNCSSLSAPTLYNPFLGQYNLATYWDTVGTNITNHIWGQGVILHIKSLTVTAQSC